MVWETHEVREEMNHSWFASFHLLSVFLPTKHAALPWGQCSPQPQQSRRYLPSNFSHLFAYMPAWRCLETWHSNSVHTTSSVHLPCMQERVGGRLLLSFSLVATPAKTSTTQGRIFAYRLLDLPNLATLHGSVNWHLQCACEVYWSSFLGNPWMCLCTLGFLKTLTTYFSINSFLSTSHVPFSLTLTLAIHGPIQGGVHCYQ